MATKYENYERGKSTLQIGMKHLVILSRLQTSNRTWNKQVQYMT